MIRTSSAGLGRLVHDQDPDDNGSGTSAAPDVCNDRDHSGSEWMKHSLVLGTCLGSISGRSRVDPEAVRRGRPKTHRHRSTGTFLRELVHCSAGDGNTWARRAEALARGCRSLVVNPSHPSTNAPRVCSRTAPGPAPPPAGSRPPPPGRTSTVESNPTRSSTAAVNRSKISPSRPRSGSPRHGPAAPGGPTGGSSVITLMTDTV